MKKPITLILFLYVTAMLSQEINVVTKNKKGKPVVLGKTNRDVFKNDAFKKWFEKNYNNYLTNDNVIRTLKSDLKKHTIKVFYGTWCGDSRKEIPRFYKVIDKAGYDEKNIQFIALDSKTKTYKQAPNREEKGLNIHRVPAFIFYKNGKEVNRIVEHPKETFERDILKIVSEKKYTPRYKVVSYLENMFTKNTTDSITKNEHNYIRYFTEIAEGSGELNTYGRVKMSANEFEKALFVFKLNAKMHPKSPYVYYSLGNLYHQTEKYDLALKHYYKSLSLYPNNKKLKEKIAEIEQLTQNNNPKN